MLGQTQCRVSKETKNVQGAGDIHVYVLGVAFGTRRSDVVWSKVRFGELREMRVPNVPSSSDWRSPFISVISSVQYVV